MNDVGGIWPRLIPILFLSVVVVATVLLIAGYGVLVGVGVLVGLGLGLIAGTVVPLWIARLSRGSVATSGFYFSSSGSHSPSPEFIEEMRELGELHTVDTGRIRSIVPVLQSSEAAGLSLELIAIEIHEAGLSMALDTRTAPGVLRPGPTARASLTDDAGTAYRVIVDGQGGVQKTMRYTVLAIPAPPVIATRLDLVIDRFLDPFEGGRSASVGPWVFSVALPASPPSV